MSRTPLDYSDTELARLGDYHQQLIQEHLLTYSQDAAFWQYKWGHFASHDFSIVLRMVADLFEDPSPSGGEKALHLYKKIASHLSTAIEENNADYFRAVAVVLEARKAGRPLAGLSRKDLFLPTPRGRPEKERTLSRIFPVALMRLSGSRVPLHPGSAESYAGVLNTRKITRHEIVEELRKDGVSISTSTLSRQLSRFKFNEFMAEQPIARKSPKLG